MKTNLRMSSGILRRSTLDIFLQHQYSKVIMRQLKLISIFVRVAVIWLALYAVYSSTTAGAVSGPLFLGLIVWWVYSNYFREPDVTIRD